MRMVTAYAMSLRSLVARTTEACNYNADATDSDDSCEYAEAGYDCEGCLNDADSDGVCDEFEIAGCQDDSACNYKLRRYG